MRKFRAKRQSFLIGSAVAIVYMTILAAASLQADRRDYHDSYLRAVQMRGVLASLTPDEITSGAVPRVFPWQRMLLVDQNREVISDTGWLDNSALTGGGSGALLEKFQIRFGGLNHAPSTDDVALLKAIKDAPDSGRSGLFNARTLGAGRSISWHGRWYGIVVLVDKRDLIAAKHVAHLMLLVSFLAVSGLLVFLMIFVYLRYVRPINRLASAIYTLDPNGRSTETRLPGEGRSDEIGLVSGAFAAAFRDARSMRTRLSEFVGDVVHELKNPVTSLRSRLELVGMRNHHTATGAQVETSHTLTDAELRRLMSDLGRTERLLGSLSDISAADSAEISGECVPSPVLRDLASAYLELGKPVEFRDESDPRALIPADPETVSTLVRVLLDNALDFSPPESPVTVACDSNGSYVRITVDDRGPGVSPELRDWIFDRFASTRKEFGEQHVGLGLAIARSLAGKIHVGGHEGRISAESNKYGGARFVLELPRISPCSSRR